MIRCRMKEPPGGVSPGAGGFEGRQAGMGARFRGSAVAAAALLLVGASPQGFGHHDLGYHEDDAPEEERGGGIDAGLRFGPLGIRFHSEGLFPDGSSSSYPSSSFAEGHRMAADGRTGQANLADLQGPGIIGDYPLRYGFRFSFAMYLDPVEDEPEGLHRKDGAGLAAGERLFSSDGDFETVPYLGLGWRKRNGDGLDVSLDIGAFLQNGTFLDEASCRTSDPLPEHCEAGAPEDGRGGLHGSFRDFEWYPVLSLGIEYRF